jgi:ATP-dependent DNA helicase RecQ
MSTPAEPPRPTTTEVADELGRHVRTLAGPHAEPRPEQLAAVTAVAAERRRTLLVARTGFGKSAVYFSAARMLRDRGWGPMVVVSPLLALMRDQVSAAARLGLAATTINSANLDEWSAVEDAIAADTVDLLLIAPERLANPGFRERVFDALLQRPISLVCDEAHCISDWGHDFRPDYLRLRRLLGTLPSWTPVLATTATANQRVTDDVASQLGEGTLVLRTSLDRESLRLSVVRLASEAERWAFIGRTVAELDGSGIVYTLTVDGAEQLATYLRSRDVDAAAYTGATAPDQRELLEQRLRANELKALVATSALGMGFDKPDLAFCVHLGLPPSPVSYYQQIGRAGRAIERAEVIALPRAEDQAIWRWFESVGLPSEEQCNEVLALLSPRKPVSLPRLESSVNLSRTRLTSLLDILDVHGAITRTKGGWLLGDPSWSYDAETAARLRALRRDEAAEMLEWASGTGCRLEYLRARLDDPDAAPCGRCDTCVPRTWPAAPPADVAAASQRLRGHDIAVEPRRQWPTGLDEPKGRIPPHAQNRLGRALSREGDGGWDDLVVRLLELGDPLADPALFGEIVDGVVGVLRRWEWSARPTWVCPVPSRHHGPVIDGLCEELGRIGKLPVHRALSWDDPTGRAGRQHEQANSAHQVANIWGRLVVDSDALPARPVIDGPVLLVDDTCSSRWTLTVAGHLLSAADSGDVLPLVLRQS